ncbi:MAG: FlgD immunoglobulin-like domain containing protein [Flavobacteriales bacterium]
MAVFKAGGGATVIKEKEKTSGAWELKQNHPNPFDSRTTISYQIPVEQNITLAVYDINGKLIKNLVHERKTKGSYNVTWNGKDASENKVSNGVYIYKFSSKRFTKTKRALFRGDLDR